MLFSVTCRAWNQQGRSRKPTQPVSCCWRKFQELYCSFGLCLSHPENLITRYRSESRSAFARSQPAAAVCCCGGWLPARAGEGGASAAPGWCAKFQFDSKKNVYTSKIKLHIKGHLVWKKGINICVRLDKFKWEDKHTFLTHGRLTVGRTCPEKWFLQLSTS